MKELAHLIGLKISCNRTKAYCSCVVSSSRKSSSITCGCCWVIRVKYIDRN